MGLRLFIESEDRKVNYYGTKFYGYMFFFAEDGKTYASVRYLFELGKLKDDDFFDYCSGVEITLDAGQFAKFITLYAEEYLLIDPERDLLQDGDIRALLASDGDKFVTWG